MGHSALGEWLEKVEGLWKEHGKGARSFLEQLDFFEQLSSQFPTAPRRVVYAKAGTIPAAAILLDEEAVVDHKLYWASVKTETEARYLEAILNSETARGKAEKWQSQGQWGAQDFDKVIFNLPIPSFDPKSELHQALASASLKAEKLAERVDVKEGEYFTRTRRRIRDALHADGVANQIDKLVTRLLNT